MDTIILAIETSCDETACAIIKNKHEVLSNVVFSQVDYFKHFGGVIPESASRMHVENITKVMKLAIKQAKIAYADIDAVAYTKGPGLIGSLHIGVVAAKSFAFAIDKPLIAVNHLYGHIISNELENDQLLYPLVALIVSGGHSELILFESEYQYKVIGKTLDDAVGEAFDKVGRIMEIAYPGGVEIDKLSQHGQPIYDIKVPQTSNTYDFSFSGLKSSVMQLVQRETKAKRDINKADLAASFQKVAIKQLINKSEKLLNEISIKQFVVAGGVAANSRLRSEIERLKNVYPNVKFSYPPLKYCGDNAAMIGAAAFASYQQNKFADLSDGANPAYRKLI